MNEKLLRVLVQIFVLMRKECGRIFEKGCQAFFGLACWDSKVRPPFEKLMFDRFNELTVLEYLKSTHCQILCLFHLFNLVNNGVIAYGESIVSILSIWIIRILFRVKHMNRNNIADILFADHLPKAVGRFMSWDA